LQGEPFHILNRVLDGAIGLAVKTFAAARALEVRGRREEYLSFVAHDLRTPLNAISLATSVLELAVPSRSAVAAHAQMFKTLRRNVQHLDALVDKVIEENTGLLSELGIKLERRTFDLWPLVEALVHDLHPVAHAAGTRLLNEVPDDLVVYADAGLLRRVFQNVIANAIAYTPRGEVLIGARQSESGVHGTLECWVRDNGEGIPRERLEKVFDKSETDPAKEGGWGLGLAIVKTFVEAHDGAVSVESKEGVGLDLPLHAAAAAKRRRPRICKEMTMLHEFLSANRDELIRRCRSKVSRAGLAARDQSGAGIRRAAIARPAGRCASLRASTPEPGAGPLAPWENSRIAACTARSCSTRDTRWVRWSTAMATSASPSPNWPPRGLLPSPSRSFTPSNRLLDNAIADAVSSYGRHREQSASGPTDPGLHDRAWRSRGPAAQASDHRADGARGRSRPATSACAAPPALSWKKALLALQVLIDKSLPEAAPVGGDDHAAEALTMQLKDVLAAKGPRVVTVPARSSVADAIRAMHAEKVGAVLVPDAEGCPVGIFSERDWCASMPTATATSTRWRSKRG
jgi:hypothetical protein